MRTGKIWKIWKLIFGPRKGEGKKGVFLTESINHPEATQYVHTREEEIPSGCAGSGSEFFTAFANKTYSVSLIKLALETAL